jgi:hypothetical protein
MTFETHAVYVGLLRLLFTMGLELDAGVRRGRVAGEF